MNQFARLHEIEKRIKAGQYPNAQSLAAEWGITARQLYLDRKKLIEVGAPLAWDARRGGWYYTNEAFSLTTFWLSESELLALFLCVEIARASGNAGLGAALEAAVEKLRGSFGETLSVDVKALGISTSCDFPATARVESSVFMDLHSAATRRQKLSMRYFTAERGQWSERVVHPYHLRFVRGEWYLIAYDERRRKVLNFNLARIEALKRLEDPGGHFERQRDWDLDTYVAQMFGAEAGDELFEIVVRFDSYQARFIRERQYHPQQRIEELDDGGLILRFKASGLNEVARWVMSYGGHAQVLAPEKLFLLIVSHLKDLNRTYGVTPDSTP